MTGPRQARDRTGRRYVWPPQPPYELLVPSVTTILKQYSKGDVLVNWASRSVAEFAVEHMDQWQNLPMDAAVDMLKRAPWRHTSNRMALGSAVHAALESWQGGEPVVEDLDLVPYIAAGIGYLDEHVDHVLEKEVSVYNIQYQYAGTVDVFATLKDGRTAVVDWKSGKAIYPETALQLSAYANCDFIGDDDGTARDLPHIDVGIVVHLKDDATYVAHEVEMTARLFRTFVALRSLQLFKDDFEQSALGKTHKGPQHVPALADNVVRLRQ